MRMRYTEQQLEFLRDGYRTMRIPALTEAFNAAFGFALAPPAIRATLKNHKFRCGRSGHFDKGHKPWNNGTKGQGLTSANSGSFGRGNVPWTTKPMGYERIDDDGYILIKVAETNPYTGHPARLKHKHLVVWEATNGPIPKGHKLRFIDGDKLNCALENLELVSNAEHLHMNRVGYSEVIPEFKPIAKTLIKLEVKTFARKRECRR